MEGKKRRNGPSEEHGKQCNRMESKDLKEGKHGLEYTIALRRGQAVATRQRSSRQNMTAPAA